MMTHSEKFQGQERVISNAVIAMLVLLTTELMMFGGLISSYLVNRIGSAMPWPPPGQPRLPAETTAINTTALIISAVTMYLAVRVIKNYSGAESRNQIKKLLLATLGLGSFFILYQGYEWVQLIGFGLTTTSSLYGGFFYIIIGTHAIHALAGLIALGIVTRLFISTPQESPDTIEIALERIKSAAFYWYFVVGIWPLIYYLVYIL